MLVGIELVGGICRFPGGIHPGHHRILLIVFHMVIGSLCFPGRRIVSDSNSLTILVFIGNGGVLLTLVVCKASRNSKTFELRKIKCILDKSRHEAISFRCF